MKDFLKIMERLRILNQIINAGSTGPAHQVAARLGISIGTLNSDLNRLRSLAEKDGVTITYSTALKSYVYTITGKFNFDWGFVKD
jgi:hypothetical protein